MRLLFEAFREHASVAQLVEQLTLNQWVEGSSPSGRTRFLRSQNSKPRFLVITNEPTRRKPRVSLLTMSESRGNS